MQFFGAARTLKCTNFRMRLHYVDVGSGGFGASRGGKLNAVDAVRVRDDETRPTIAYHFQQLIYARTHAHMRRRLTARFIDL